MPSRDTHSLSTHTVRSHTVILESFLSTHTQTHHKITHQHCDFKVPIYRFSTFTLIFFRGIFFAWRGLESGPAEMATSRWLLAARRAMPVAIGIQGVFPRTHIRIRIFQDASASDVCALSCPVMGRCSPITRIGSIPPPNTHTRTRSSVPFTIFPFTHWHAVESPIECDSNSRSWGTRIHRTTASLCHRVVSVVTCWGEQISVQLASFRTYRQHTDNPFLSGFAHSKTKTSTR